MPAKEDVRTIVARELSQMAWSTGYSKQRIVEHFRMAPTVRDMLRARLPDGRYTSSNAVLDAIPAAAWEQVQYDLTHGSAVSHFLDSPVAHTPPPTL